jgi:PAS domain S-box-containing protein
LVEQIPWAKLGHSSLAFALAADPSQGGLWLGFSQGGVAYFKDGRVRASYTTADGLGEGRVSALQVDRDGTLWAATEGGLSRVKNGRVATLTSKNGLPCDAVHWVVEDDDHAFWLNMACGLVRLGRPELDRWVADPLRTIQATVFDSSDGVGVHSNLISASSPRVAKSQDGKLWFLAGDGISVFDPRDLLFNELPPPVHIEQIIADRKTYWQNSSGDASSRPPRLPPRVRDLTIDYTALSFVAPEKVRFRYKLEGWESDWQDAGNRRQAFYDNLPPGNYRFRVAACNNSGVWNEAGDTLDFSIAPAYYQTIWFRALCAAVALALVWALFQLRIRQLQNQERKLRELIETIPTGAWITGPDGSNEFVNQRWVEYTGLSAKDTAGLGWHAVIHPEDLNRHMEKWRASLASGQPFEDEARFRRAADGKYGWFLSRGVPLRDKHGSILKWYGIITDIEDRKQAEQALERSEAYLTEAQKLSHTGSFAYNPGSGKTLYWSEELFRIFALDPRRGVLEPDESFRLVHPDDRNRVSEECLQGFRAKGQFSQDYRLLLRDGTVKHLHAMWHPVLDKDGEVVEYVGTAADVTERWRAEDALWRSQAYLTEAQLLSHTGSFGWKPSTGEVLWSEETYRIYQYSPTAKPTVELVLERVHPEDRALAQQIIGRASQEEKDYEHEYRLLMPDGSVKYLHIMAHALRDESGSVEFVGAVMDVTAAKQAEERLRQSEAELRQLVDVIPQQVYVFDADFNPLFANRREREYTGLTPEEAQSKDAVAKIFHPDDLKRLEVLHERAIREAAPFELEARIRGKDGQYRWFLIRDNPLRDEQGHVLRWYGTRTDIEDRKRAEEALRQAQTELAHVTRIMTLGELVASIAHEVNQPLSGVVVNANACLRWMAGDSPNLKEAREAVRRIVRDGKRAGDVITRIRALATKTATAKERLNLNEAIKEVVALAQDEVRRNRVILRMELGDALPPVLGDRVQLQQVVLNLVMNGIEAMSSVEERPRELIVRTRSDDAGLVRVIVQDSGIGLDAQSMERIFEAFYTTKRGGMGMGLSISRSIIENHGGKLWAVANDPPGTTVQFTIPKCQP